ncbi:unnamed protein product [Urochloa humidicola]
MEADGRAAAGGGVPTPARTAAGLAVATAVAAAGYGIRFRASGGPRIVVVSAAAVLGVTSEADEVEEPRAAEDGAACGFAGFSFRDLELPKGWGCSAPIGSILPSSLWQSTAMASCRSIDAKQRAGGTMLGVPLQIWRCLSIDWTGTMALTTAACPVH